MNSCHISSESFIVTFVHFYSRNTRFSVYQSLSSLCNRYTSLWWIGDYIQYSKTAAGPNVYWLRPSLLYKGFL